MKVILLSSLLAATLLSVSASSQSIDTTGAWKMLPDTARTVHAAAGVADAADTTVHATKIDTVKAGAAVAAPDTAAKKTEASTFNLIRRNYNSRQQLLLASGMMIFIIAIMTLAQQFNPN
jgi:hypothetical protein